MDGQAYQIQDPTDQLRALLLAYGISTPPAQFFLTPLVSPVSIVDSRVTLTAQSSPLIWSQRTTAGILTNPAANTRLFDTGQMAAGTWHAQIWISGSTAGTGFVRIKQRNAADAADVFVLMARYSQSPVAIMIEQIFSIAANERIVCENSVAPGAGIEVQAVIWLTQLA